MSSQSLEQISIIILKVSSGSEIVREIKRIQQLTSHRTIAGAARCNPEVGGMCPEWGIESALATQHQKMPSK